MEKLYLIRISMKFGEWKTLTMYKNGLNYLKIARNQILIKCFWLVARKIWLVISKFFLFISQFFTKRRMYVVYDWLLVNVFLS